MSAYRMILKGGGLSILGISLCTILALWTSKRVSVATSEIFATGNKTAN